LIEAPVFDLFEHGPDANDVARDLSEERAIPRLG